MKKYFLTLFFFLGSVSVADPYTPRKLPPLRVIEDFSSFKVRDLPSSLRAYPFQRSKAEKVYSVQQEGDNRYLHGKDDRDFSVQVFEKFYWETKRWPYFSWRWRAVTLPKGAAENNPAVNDSACGVYVVFGGYTGKVLKYVWSSTLPVGSVHEKKPGKFYFIVLESGPAKKGIWQTPVVNVVEDYKRIFKEEPSRTPDGFGLLTDGNATHSPAECDYDDFKISEKPLRNCQDCE